MPSKKSNKTGDFYDNLIIGNEVRGVLGKDKRYNSDKIIYNKAVDKNYTQVVEPHINKNDRVLDYGCGPGSFLTLTSSLCKNIIGVDIGKKFVEECHNNINKYNINNAETFHISPCKTGLQDEEFDKIVMVDVIHHLENIDEELLEIQRLLKPKGKLIVFEPNKLNPLMYIWHLIDENERGLLRVGTPWSYRNILDKYFYNIRIIYSGLVIGPDSWVFGLITTILNSKIIYPIFGWLNPKIFIIATKK